MVKLHVLPSLCHEAMVQFPQMNPTIPVHQNCTTHFRRTPAPIRHDDKLLRQTRDIRFQANRPLLEVFAQRALPLPHQFLCR